MKNIYFSLIFILSLFSNVVNGQTEEDKMLIEIKKYQQQAKQLRADKDNKKASKISHLGLQKAKELINSCQNTNHAFAIDKWIEANFLYLEIYKDDFLSPHTTLDRITLENFLQDFSDKSIQKLQPNDMKLVEIFEKIQFCYHTGSILENMKYTIKYQESIITVLENQKDKDYAKILTAFYTLAFHRCILNETELVKGVRQAQIDMLKSKAYLLDKITDTLLLHTTKASYYNVMGLMFANVDKVDFKHQNLDAAMFYYEKARNFAFKTPHKRIKYIVLSNIGIIYGDSFPQMEFKKGDTTKYREADILYKESLKVFFEMDLDYQKENIAVLSDIYYFMANNYAKMKNENLAFLYSHKSLQAILSHYTDNDIMSIPTLTQESQIKNYSQTAKAIYIKLNAFQRLYETQKTPFYLEKIEKMLEFCETFTKFAEEENESSLSGIYESMLGYYIKFYHDIDKNKYPEKAKNLEKKIFEYQQKSTNHALNQKIKMRILWDKENPIARENFYNLQSTLANTEIKINLENHPQKKKIFENEREKIKKSIQLLEAEVTKKMSISHINILTLEEVQAKLDDETLLVCFYWNFPLALRFAITKKEIKVETTKLYNIFDTEIAKGRADTITKNFTKFYYNEINNNPKSYLEKGYENYKLVFGSFLSHFKDKKRLLIFTQDKFLNTPFSAFLTEKVPYNKNKAMEWHKLPYVALQFEKGIVNCNSLFRFFDNANSNTNYEQEMVGIAPIYEKYKDGNVMYDERPLRGLDENNYFAVGNRQRKGFYMKDKFWIYNEILNTKSELMYIQSTLKNKKLKGSFYFGLNAKEEILKKRLNTRILHISTHSYYHPRNINYSSISFIQPLKKDSLLVESGKIEDGNLYYPEIPFLDLKSDLVVLSGCESGLGYDMRDGYVSLSQNFLQINIPNVISSIWAVDDQKTYFLMKNFYKYLYEKDILKYDYAEAMQRAIFDMIKNPETADPQYWASFRMDLAYKAL